MQNGEVVIVSVNAEASTFDLIPLNDLNAGEELLLGNQAVIDGASSPMVITIEQKVLAGTLIQVNPDEPANLFLSIENNFELDSESDFLAVFTKNTDSFDIDFGISWIEVDSLTNIQAPIDSDILNLQSVAHHQYHVKNGASGTVNMLKSMVSDPANWRNSNKPFSPFGTSFRVLSAPVIQFHQNISSIEEGDSIKLNVAIYEHDGSRLTVDASFHPLFSTADTNDVTRFKSYTYNFTGLIGNAIYETQIPLEDDNVFEGRETAFFELTNLSGGNYGDFNNHAAFIIDNEIPDIQINDAVYASTLSSISFSIENRERAFLDISNWEIQIEESSIQFGEEAELQPFEVRTIELAKYVGKSNELEFEEDEIRLVILNAQGTFVKSVEITREDDNTGSSLSQNTVELTANPIQNAENGIKIVSTSNPEYTITDVDEQTIRYDFGWKSEILEQELLAENDLDLFYWDNYEATFKIVEAFVQDSLIGKPVFYFKDSTIVQLEDLEIDSTLTGLAEPLDLTFTISAFDLDGNGFINGSEGLNPMVNTTSYPLKVNSLLAEIKTQYPELKFKDYIIAQNLNEKFEVEILSKGDLIRSNQSFWIQADTTIEQQLLELNIQNILNNTIIDEAENEPISNLVLELSTENETREILLNFFETDIEIPAHTIAPELIEGITLGNNESLNVGLFADLNWNRVLNLAYEQNSKLAFPLTYSAKESSRMALNILDWNLEGGWQVFIEDIETEELFELSISTAFEFEYLVNTALNEVELEGREVPIKELNLENRFRLVLIPPGVEEQETGTPEQIELSQNYPNPFNPATTISFYLPEAVDVKLSIFNIVGQPIAVLTEGMLSSGDHQFEWNASGYPSGMYIYQLEVGTKILTRKMTLVK